MCDRFQLKTLGLWLIVSLCTEASHWKCVRRPSGSGDHAWPVEGGDERHGGVESTGSWVRRSTHRQRDQKSVRWAPRPKGQARRWPLDQRSQSGLHQWQHRWLRRVPHRPATRDPDCLDLLFESFRKHACVYST